MRPLTIAIASGKGGTGKTTVAVNLALVVPNAQYLDCDVEAPNGHLFLHSKNVTATTVRVLLPQIDNSLCTRCGECADACKFNALAVTKQRVLVFADLCHSCGACRYVCPIDGVITEIERDIGTVTIGVAEKIPTVQGLLNVGESSAVPVINAVHKQALPLQHRILDAPPGTACAMVETVRGADYCVLVTEPTPFGLNDLELAVGVTRALGVPCGLVLNRCDVGNDTVLNYCHEQNIPVLMSIPFERSLAEAYSRGIPWVTAQPVWREQFQTLWQAIEEKVITA